MREELFEHALLVGFQQLPEAAYRAFPDQDLGKGHLPGEGHQVRAPDRVLGQVDLAVDHATALQQRLGLAAEPARVSGVEGDAVPVRHPNQSVWMPGSFKTEAVVLRSIRYGEADRVLHL